MGAWEHVYRKGSTADLGTPYAYGILAVKQELAYNDETGLNLTLPRIGIAGDRAIRHFQERHALVVDGQVGVHTAALLFRRRLRRVQQRRLIPDDLLCKIAHLESALDPAAVGVADPADLGIMQIHFPRVDVTVEEAFTPAFAFGWAARRLQSAYASLGDWDATAASWNIGLGGATYWLANDKPNTLYASWFNDADGNPIDLGARAARYLELVKGQSC